MRTWTIEYDGTMYQALCGSDWLVYVMIYGFLCLGEDRDMAIFWVEGAPFSWRMAGVPAGDFLIDT